MKFYIKIKEIHLGGGTPTFFNSTNLSKLINGIVSTSELEENYEFPKFNLNKNYYRGWRFFSLCDRSDFIEWIVIVL